MTDKLSIKKLFAILFAAFTLGLILELLNSITPAGFYYWKNLLSDFLVYGFILIALSKAAKTKKVKRGLLFAFTWTGASLIVYDIIFLPLRIVHSYELNMILTIVCMVVQLVVLPALFVSLMFKLKISVKKAFINPVTIIFFVIAFALFALFVYLDYRYSVNFINNFDLHDSTMSDVLGLITERPPLWQTGLYHAAANLIFYGVVFRCYRSLE